MSNLHIPNAVPEARESLKALRVGYSRDPAALLLGERDVLAVIGFGAGAERADDPRAIVVGLDPAGAPPLEVWRANAPVRAGRAGDIAWSTDGDYGFVAVEVDEAEHGDIESAAEHAYRELIAFVHASATPFVLRLWNYLDAINLGDGDAERYRRFCVGRARGMAERWTARYPAATAIGRRDGARVVQVYALTARIAGTPVENPRQVSAWRYPREYGPAAPTFARGMTTPAHQFLISGTAAVVGSASQHNGDLAAQLDETLANLGSLLTAGRPGAKLGASSVLKVYVRRPEDAALAESIVRERAGALDGLVVLAGDICRRELLIEIDGMHG